MLYEVITLEKSNFFKRDKDDVQIRLFNSIMKRDYLVIPLLLEGNNHYKHPYSYQIDIDNKKLIMEDNDNRIHSKFIYSVFYPVNSVNKKCKYNLLIKIRVLQYLSWNEKIAMTNQSIINFFKSKFHYTNHDITRNNFV